MVLLTSAPLMAVWVLTQACGVAGDSTVVQGTGSSLPMSLYLNALFAYRFVDSSVEATFESQTNDQAVCRLTNYSKECAASDTAVPHHLDWASLLAPLTSDSYSRYPDLQMYPTVAGAVVPIFNLNGATELVLGMETLAKIWSGRITTWDHPDIRASNPNFTSWNVPTNQSITLVALAEYAGSTQLLKKALGGVDPLFLAQVGTSTAPVWNGTKPVFRNGTQFLLSHVMRHPYTLSYLSMADALSNQIPFAKLNHSGVVVEASVGSIQYAMLERGVSFGNNGDAAVHLTADLYNADNSAAWPITTYTYVAVRKSTLRPGATCATVSALVDFWLWFWNSGEVTQLASSLGFCTLPDVVRDFVVARFKSDMQCAGSLVYQATEVPVIRGYGPGSAVIIFDKFDLAYALVNSSVTLNYSTLASDKVDTTALLQAGGFVASASPLSTSLDVVRLVLAGEMLAGISQYVLTLSGLTLAKILNGDIKTWLHADIVALNPNGIRDASGNLVNDTAQAIVLVQGPTAGSAPLVALMKTYYPAYTGAAILAAEKFTDPQLVWSAVLGTPYSFSIAAVVGQLPEELQLTSIMSGGVAVAPSLATGKACAANATYNTATNNVVFDLENRSCYPLLLPLYVTAQRQCPTPSSTTARTVAFLQWMFSDATLSAALTSLNLVSLNEMSSDINAANKEALFRLACGIHSSTSATDMTTLLLAIIIPIVAVVLIGVGACGWWLWRITEYNRMLRKKFSNDNVAESCAEAIARFDLAAVAWLKEVKEPNKIQQAFLAIITLLTEVKPYIPDQLLSRLTAGKANVCNEEETDNEVEQASAVASESRYSHRLQDHCQKDGRLSMSLRTTYSSPSTPTSSVKARRVHQSVPSTDASRPALSIKDWTRKRCTYMCVRFGSAQQHSERRLTALALAAGRIVDIAKANGATIDAVGVDFINVHWGVTSILGPSSVRAVQAGLEMGKLQDTLPEDQRAAFWLQMGIGKGLCDCGTVSSESGHRFFVVWGPEASLAIEIATNSLPKRVLASLLITPAVYQEVQFTVQCMPRLWHHDILLWEPRCVLKKGEDDEWMYELKKMGDDDTLSHKVLLEAFLASKDKNTSVENLSAHITELRSLHGRDMSIQDIASLDLLLTVATPHPRHGHDPADSASP